MAAGQVPMRHLFWGVWLSIELPFCLTPRARSGYDGKSSSFGFRGVIGK
jgi:hypothetical protein